jgi:hypothetical protein
MGGNVDEELIEYLVSIGALEYVFTDDEGGYIYRLTPDAKELVPDLYEDHVKDFNSSVFSLWNYGLIDIVFDDDGEPLISLNENTEYKDMRDKLYKKELDVLKEIVFVWNKNNNKDE